MSRIEGTVLGLVLAAVALPVAIRAQTAEPQKPIVTVTGGHIRGGFTSGRGVVFKGIPYAQPPVGDLRWREPMTVEPWTGIRDATSFGAICPQKPSPHFPNPAGLYSEDCLFVNVWAAEWPAKTRKPVFLWIHGGGNYSGASSEAVHDGESLARRGVVVVSFNYRLGSFGFFSHPELTRESPNKASGNQGLLDQLAALRWVRANIAAFGGDPERITIGGMSAGAIDAALLMTSPLSANLFHRVAGQSGAVGTFPMLLVRTEAEKQCQAHAATWGLMANSSLAELRAVPSSKIVDSEPRGVAPYLNVTIDGYVLREHPVRVFAEGRQHPVPILVGSAARDFVFGRDAVELGNAIENAYGPLAPRAHALYAAPDAIYGTPIVQWVTDTSFRCPTIQQLLWHVALRQSAFQYEFTRVPQQETPRVSLHGNDTRYLFGTFERAALGTNLGRWPATAVDRDLSEKMQQYWTNFVKTGDPNGGSLPVWPRFDSSSRAYLEFSDHGITAKQGLRRAFCDLYIENTARRLTR